MSNEIKVSEFNDFQNKVLVIDTNQNGILDEADGAFAAAKMDSYNKGDTIPFSDVRYRTLREEFLKSRRSIAERLHDVKSRNQSVLQQFDGRFSFGDPKVRFRCMCESIGVYAAVDGTYKDKAYKTGEWIGDVHSIETINGLNFTEESLRTEISKLTGIITSADRNRVDDWIKVTTEAMTVITNNGYSINGQLLMQGNTIFADLGGSKESGGFNRRVEIEKIDEHTLSITMFEFDQDVSRVKLDLSTKEMTEIRY